MRQQFNAEMLLMNLSKLEEGAQALKFLEIACSKMRDIEQTAPETFSAMGWEFRVGELDALNREAQIMRQALNLEVLCVPQVALLKENVDASATMVTCISGCAFRSPLSCYNDMPALNQSVQQQFVRDISKLAESDLYHPLGVGGYSNWLLHPTNHHIVLRGWDSVRPIAERERERLVDVLTALFATYERDQQRHTSNAHSSNAHSSNAAVGAYAQGSS